MDPTVSCPAKLPAVADHPRAARCPAWLPRRMVRRPWTRTGPIGDLTSGGPPGSTAPTGAATKAFRTRISRQAARVGDAHRPEHKPARSSRSGSVRVGRPPVDYVPRQSIIPLSGLYSICPKPETVPATLCVLGGRALVVCLMRMSRASLPPRTWSPPRIWSTACTRIWAQHVHPVPDAARGPRAGLTISVRDAMPASPAGQDRGRHPGRRPPADRQRLGDGRGSRGSITRAGHLRCLVRWG